jgi:DNA-binding NtrC family response regulator
VPSVTGLGERVRGWLHREQKPIVPRTILIVDGSATTRQSTRRLVESLGYQSVLSSSVADALARLDKEDPDFVLLGFELEDATGLEALAQIRAVDPKLAVIMLAHDLWDSRVADALRQGAVAYLAKPFGTDDLREVLGRR